MNGAYGEGAVAFERLFNMLDKIAWVGGAALLLIMLIWAVMCWRGA